MWAKLLAINKFKLDMSSVQLDSSHTPAKRGGEAVAYRGRKKAKTTNALFLTDKIGIPLAMLNCVGGNHNYFFEIENSFLKILTDLKQFDISINGLLLNADAGFDRKNFRTICFANDIIANIVFNKRRSKDTDNQPLLDDLFYKERFSVEKKCMD